MSSKRKTPARTKALTARSMLATLVATAPAAAPRATMAETKAPAPTPANDSRGEKPTMTAVSAAISGDERHRMIARIAYEYAERAGFQSDPLHNWLAAEREVETQLGRLAS